MASTRVLAGSFIIFLTIIMPQSVLGDWKVYYTGKAAGMFGSYGRGSFPTKAQCEAYQATRPGFERNNSYCSGFDAASSKKQPPPAPAKPGQAEGQPKKSAGPDENSLRNEQFARDREDLLKKMKMPPPEEGLKPGGTAFFNSGGSGPEARKEQDKFETMNEQWAKKQKQLIEQRTKRPNRYAAEIYRSLRMNSPPRLLRRKYDELEPGDVILISRDETHASFWINLGDRLTTDLRSPASHTVLYLKKVKGKNLFLDHLPGKGSEVIDEDEFLRRYGSREMLAASPRIAIAQPLRKSETERIWENTKKLLDIDKTKSGNVFDRTGYGLYGNDNMVCSEADRWVLVRSGRDIPESASFLKRLLGIHYGPANFFADDYNFVITPLWAPIEK